jgi:hypothetical protein
MCCFGVDNTFLTRALDNDLFIPYESPLLEYVPEQFILDPEYRVTRRSIMVMSASTTTSLTLRTATCLCRRRFPI